MLFLSSFVSGHQQLAQNSQTALAPDIIEIDLP
jgi:hypothetical protein